MKRKVILVYSRSPLNRDERVQRQIKLCSRDYDVVSVGLGPYEGPVVRHIDLAQYSQVPRTPVAVAPDVTQMNFAQKLDWVLEREGVTMLALLAMRKVLPGFGPIEKAIEQIRIERRAVSYIRYNRANGQREVVVRRNNSSKRMTEAAWSLLSRHAADMDTPYPAQIWRAEREISTAKVPFERLPVLEQLREDFEYFESLEIQRKHQQVINELHTIDFDLAIANDLTAINVVVPVAREKGAKIIYDAHEFSPGQRVLNEETAWALYFAAYKLGKYLPLCDEVISVCESITREYVKWFDIKPLTTIINAPYYAALTPAPLDGDRIRLVHHGVASRPRALELMIDTVLLLDERFTLDFYLVTPDLAYFEQLQARCQGNQRIRFQPPVPSAQICESINRYDLGFYILPPVNFNQKHALPNKFFEFVQARLGVAIGPSTEMMAYLHKYGLGVVAADFTPAAMAAALASITPEALANYKANAHRYAAELSASPQMATLEQLVARVMAAEEVAA